MEKILDPVFLVFIFFLVIHTYLPSIQKEYMADDYLLLSQGAEHGFLLSLIIPFKGHFIPLFRLLMQASHAVFGNAAPMRVVILAFHLLNTALIFYIVRRITESSLLSCIAAFTFGISFQTAGAVLWVITGVWVVSLTFLLFTYICFENILDENQGAQVHAVHENLRFFNRRQLSYYYISLLLFAAALGFFTIAAFAGLFLFLYFYVELLRSKKFRPGLRDYVSITVPFLLILGIYFGLRAYLNQKFLPFQDYFFQKGAATSASLAEQLDIVRGLPLHFYGNFIRRTVPYFPDYLTITSLVVILLFIKELIIRPEKAKIAGMWSLYAVTISAIPVFGRLSFALKLSGSAQYILPWWYFYHAGAGISIALGVLLNPPSFLAKKVRASWPVKTAFAVAVIILLLFINVGKMKDIRTEAQRLAHENRRFGALARQYERSMEAFLTSPEYSANSAYLFANMPAANNNYSSGWSIMQRDIFRLFFPNIRNISFTDQVLSEEYQYIWSPAGVIRRFSIQRSNGPAAKRLKP